MIWSEEKIIQLRNLYPNNKTEDIMNIMNISKKSIESKAYRLKLLRTDEHRSLMISNRNKIVGTDITYDIMKNTALKYKTRGEFQRLDSSIYTTTRRYGLLDELCSHMIKGNYSIPQLILYYIINEIFKNDEVLYNTYDIIYPYEIDIFISKYNLAFEYDGKYWHKDNEKDILKNNLCLSSDIKLIRIVEKNRNYIKDIKEQLIENINIINLYINISAEDINIINETDIYKYINESIDDLDHIKKTINKYIYYSDFIKNEVNLYNKLKRRGLINELTNNLIKSRLRWSDEMIIQEVSKYVYLGDFIKNSTKCYNYIKKNKKEYLIKDLLSKYRKSYN